MDKQSGAEDLAPTSPPPLCRRAWLGTPGWSGSSFCPLCCGTGEALKRLEPIDFSQEHQRPVYRREDVLREAEKLSAGGPLDVLSARVTR